ncbi:MAG: hypothetical protein KDD21_00440 [Bacteroidetes bacterium]|nr:hypothetical protein [Bacteroidota bacterium]
MSKFIQIDSIRAFEDYPSYQILYEFEDDFSSQAKLPINQLSKYKYVGGKFLNKYFSQFLSANNESSINRARKFSIMMTPDYHRMYWNKSTVVPYIIDYWKRYDTIFDTYFDQFPLVYISGLEVFEYLKSKQTRVNIKHLPLSISDKHFHNFFHKEIAKDIDIINVGRKNKVLDAYIQQYLEKFPATNYVHREMENGENIYYSTINGKIGKLETRTDLLNTLSRAKIAIVTSPGIDGGELRTGGFNPVTPRIFEAAIGKCFLIGKYEKNVEFYSFGLDNLVEMPTSYNEFEQIVSNKLQVPFNLHQAYQQFLERNLNSKRVAQILSDCSV